MGARVGGGLIALRNERARSGGWRNAMQGITARKGGATMDGATWAVGWACDYTRCGLAKIVLRGLGRAPIETHS